MLGIFGKIDSGDVALDENIEYGDVDLEENMECMLLSDFVGNGGIWLRTRRNAAAAACKFIGVLHVMV
jgi:hypothetical protein